MSTPPVTGGRTATDGGTAPDGGTTADGPAPRAAARPVRDGLALGLAAGSAGLAFGAAAAGSGLSVAQACVLSLLAFTGASQFALVGTLAGGGSLISGAVGAILLGSRNALYGLRMTGVLESPR